MAKIHNSIEDFQQEIIEELNRKVEELTQENQDLAARLAIEMSKSIEADKRFNEYSCLIEELNECKRDYLVRLSELDDLKREFKKKSNDILKEIKKEFK